MRSRTFVALLLALAGTALLSPPAAASAPGDREVRRIIRDCVRDDDLDRKYSLRALRTALRRLPDDIREYTGCERAIRRAIRQARRKLNREVRQIIRDCVRDDDLDRTYSLRALRAAFNRLPDDVLEYTGCERAIRRAIRRAERKLRREVRQVIRDCSRDDDLDRRYSLPALRAALRRLPDDVRADTGCRRAIRHAIRRAERPGSGRAGRVAARA